MYSFLEDVRCCQARLSFDCKSASHWHQSPAAEVAVHALRRNHLGHLISDFLVTLSLMMLHALILLCQGMAFSVAMNSKRNHALVGLIIAINFVEMKGTISTESNAPLAYQLMPMSLPLLHPYCPEILSVLQRNVYSWRGRSEMPAAIILSR